MQNPDRPDETREMRLISMIVELCTDVPDVDLAEFIARRRTPGPGWRSWDRISFELAEIISEIVTDGTLRQWAARYGIPEHTKADDSGEVSAAAFAEAIGKVKISIN